MGRLTRDPERRETSTGTPVTSFSLAVDRGYVSRDGGERQTDFIDVVAWRNTADFVAKYFAKGQMCAVSGRLQMRDWTDKDGNKRRNAEVVADHVYFTESKKSRDASIGAGGGSPEPRESVGAGYSTPVETSDFAELDMDDGDLPF